jgi:two-component system, NtrC family, sensor kinase
MMGVSHMSREGAEEPSRGAPADADAAAREERSHLVTMLEFAPALIIAVKPDGIIEYINWVLPQYSKAEVIGSHWLRYIPADLEAQMQAALQAVLATGATQTYETTTTGPDGTALWFSSQIGAIRRGDDIVGAVIVSQDITERKRTQAELLAARRLAVLGTLAAGVAHEINTPIQFVGDSLRFLRSAGDDLLALIETFQSLRRECLAGRPLAEAVAAATRAEEEADLHYLRENIPQAFERCLDGLGRVTTIVRSLKEFAHPSGKDMAPADLNHAVESTLSIARNEYKYVADVDTEFGDLPPVMCHIGEINQVVLNIVVNAGHAIADAVSGTSARGRLRVRTWRERDDAVIAISDTGKGIPEAIRTRIFDPFFTTKEVGKGTGQGLAIAWTTVVDQHGGTLTFDTTVGEGTTFFIRLPIAGKPGAAAPPG